MTRRAATKRKISVPGGLQGLLKRMEASGQLPQGTVLDGLGNKINPLRQAKKREQGNGMSGRQWTRLRKLVSRRARVKAQETGEEPVTPVIT